MDVFDKKILHEKYYININFDKIENTFLSKTD